MTTAKKHLKCASQHASTSQGRTACCSHGQGGAAVAAGQQAQRPVPKKTPAWRSRKPLYQAMLMEMQKEIWQPMTHPAGTGRRRRHV
jgi:hypothetical protein